MKARKLKTIILLAISICCFLMGIVASNIVTNYAQATTQAQTTIENDNGFYMTNGAEVRIPDEQIEKQENYDQTGIRYTVNLQSEYVKQLKNTYKEVTFYSLIAINGAEAVVPETFTGEQETTVIGNVAMLQWKDNNYGKLEDGWYTSYITPTNMQKGFDVKLTVRAVAKVVDSDNAVDYLYAKLNDNTRTMEAIALESYLSNKDDPTYAYLNKYYGTIMPYNGGYAEENGDSIVSFAEELSGVELSANAYACVGASPVEMTDGVVNLDSAEKVLEVGKTYNVSIFDGDKVYTKPMKYVTKIIDQASDLEVFNLTDKDITGYYVVTQDIDASGIAAMWHYDFVTQQNGVGANRGFSYKFKGVFDGNGHTVKANVTYGGLFGVLEDATIMNTKFVLNIGGNNGTANNTGNRPTGLAKRALDSTISNVYAELNTGADIAASRGWAISLIQDSPNLNEGYLMLENLVVKNNDTFASLTVESGWRTVGALFYSDSGRAHSDRDNYVKNVYVIAPKTFGADNSGYVAMASGTALATFAGNDTESKNAVDELLTNNTFYQLANVTRYNTVADFVKSFAWQDKIPDFIMDNLLVYGATANVGDTTIEHNGAIDLPLNVAKTVTMSIGAKALTDVSLSSNDDSVTISDTSLTLTKAGTATVTASGKFNYSTDPNEPRYTTVVVTFTVSLNATTYDKKVLFSGMDGDVDAQKIFGAGAVLTNAYDSDGNALTVTDGKISGLTNTTNAPIEKTLLLGTSANEWKYVTFTVYTKLLDDANDLKVFELTTHNVTGCYLVTKDIYASEEKAIITHTDITMLESGQTSRDFDYTFAGVFDGGNHTVEVNVSNCGLFGRLQDSTISNVNFIFNISGAAIGGNYIPTGLACEILQGANANQGTTKIYNVYAELNVATGLTVASSRTWALALMQNGNKHVILENVVVVNNDDFENLKPNGWVAGALFYVDAGRTDSGIRTQYRKNVFIIAPERLGKADDGTGNPTANYKYYVSMSGGTAIQVFASNDTAGVDAAKVNTGNATQYTYENVTRYSDAKTFVDSNAWSGIISDSVMNAVRLNNVTE